MNYFTLSQICELVTDGTHDSPKLLDSGVPFIKGKNISSGEIDFNSCDYISAEDHSKCILRVKPELNDILLANIGSIGDTAIVKENIEFSIKNVALLRANKTHVDPYYLYLYLSSPKVTEEIKNLKLGSAQQYISLESLRNFKINLLHSINEQIEIADIVRSYIDLIDINNKRIKLLEQSARLLYKEWFVHFRYPGHQKYTIINGIPDKWQHGLLKDFFHTTSGGTPSRKKTEFYNGGINWVKTQELNGNFIFESEEKITHDAINNSSAKILPTNTVLVAMYGATIGQSAILANSAACNQACCAIYNDDHTLYPLIYSFIESNKQNLINLAQGAAQKNISQEIIKNLKILYPPKDLLNEFLLLATPYFEQKKYLQQTNQKLITCREQLVYKIFNKNGK